MFENKAEREKKVENTTKVKRVSEKEKTFLNWRLPNLEVFLFDGILEVPFDILQLAYPCVVFLKNALKLFCRSR